MILAKLQSRLVADWREASRWWSVRWNALGALLLPLLTMVPAMPEPVQALFPPPIRVVVVALWCVASIAMRLWSQKKPGG